ncbi:UNVERIFIED_ORG: cell division septum initiation protein DivIVA [Arthrobacter globiformis]|nr:cell division septum initiation protein DivIVA [Arthrobacter globiformis]
MRDFFDREVRLTSEEDVDQFLDTLEAALEQNS